MNELLYNIFSFLFKANPKFTLYLFKYGVFTFLGWSTIVLSLLVAIVFYYVINSPRFNRWWHWLIFLGINFLINLLVTYFYSYSQLSSVGYYFTVEYFYLALAFAVISIVLYIAISFIIRWGSSNCRQTPFPN